MLNNDVENLVSIVIPSREKDYLLNLCINKIRALYKNVKIIVILDKIQNEKEDNIIFLKSVNRNMSAKRNLGVKNAKTEYVAFIDSDAYPQENWLENAIDFLDSHKDYTAVTGCQYNPPEDSFEQICLRKVRFNRLFTHKEWCKVIDTNTKEQDCTEFMTSNVIIRKKDYDNLNGMDENIFLAEDNEFSERLTENGYKIRFIPNICVFHRESKMYPFFRKIYCLGYYYANMFSKGKTLIKDVKKTISQFFPLLGIILFFSFVILFHFLGINPVVLLIFPLLIIVLLLNEALIEAKKLPCKKFLGFFMIFFYFCLFCVVWVTGTFLGMINFPSEKVQNFYNHY